MPEHTPQPVNEARPTAKQSSTERSNIDPAEVEADLANHAPDVNVRREVYDVTRVNDRIVRRIEN